MTRAPEILYRAATPVDAVTLSAIEHRVSPGPWSLSQFISACRSERDRVRVACAGDDRVLGFAVFSETAGEASLLNIAVDTPAQGQGIARGLLAFVLAELREQGCTRMVLEVRASNRAALSLYRGVGFNEDGIRKGYYPAGDGREDALLMSLPLTGTL